MSLKALRFWLLFAVLAPLLLLQAAWVQSTARRLPLARGEYRGIATSTSTQTDAPSVSLLCLGESPMAGVGVTAMSLSVGVRLAEALAQRMQGEVHWQVLAGNGCKALTLWRRCVAELPQGNGDVAVIAMGVNDCTGLTPLRHFSGQVAAIARCVRERQGARVFVAAVPPVGAFTALPQPLRWILGQRAALLQQALQEHAGRGSLFELLPVEFPMQAQLLAEDGYHPSAQGHAWWGEAMAVELHARLHS